MSCHVGPSGAASSQQAGPPNNTCAETSGSCPALLSHDAKTALLLPCRLAAELGAADAKGPGSLRVGLLDNLWTMSKQQLLAGAKVHE